MTLGQWIGKLGTSLVLTFLAMMTMHCRRDTEMIGRHFRPAGEFVTGTIRKASQPVTIDGKLDEAVWRQAAPIRVVYPHTGGPAVLDQPAMTVRLAWDEDYLYIAYEVFDTDLVALGNGLKEGPATNRREGTYAWFPEKHVDYAEFVISFEEPAVGWEVLHTAGNHLDDAWITVVDKDSPMYDAIFSMQGVLMRRADYIDDSGPAKVKSAVTLKVKADGQPSTPNRPGDTDTGYLAEIGLPWAGLGASKAARTAATHHGNPGGFDMTGQSVRLLSVYLNGNGQPTYFHSSPTRPPGGMFASSVRYFPRYLFVGASLAPASDGSAGDR